MQLQWVLALLRGLQDHRGCTCLALAQGCANSCHGHAQGGSNGGLLMGAELTQVRSSPNMLTLHASAMKHTRTYKSKRVMPSIEVHVMLGAAAGPVRCSHLASGSIRHAAIPALHHWCARSADSLLHADEATATCKLFHAALACCEARRVLVVAGHAWMTEYGDPYNETDFEYLIKYSPLHNVRVPAGSHQYPAVLLTTGDTDPKHACCGTVLCLQHYGSSPLLCCCIMS